MSNLMTLSEELDDAAKVLDYCDTYSVQGTTGAHARAVNILRAKAAALRNKGQPKPKRKTVVGYVGSRHVKVKVQGNFEDATE